ncbi:hypothetical protein GWR56_13675 [Mucilaginibacter sp. 14171R-50]|uniref:DNA/RNA non-specific endonuclease n=1 Tax=Mucilaginibacter sp. 14171R-50 TaxID=2703789 RepID=UPI00138C1188|nr:DNA/RNA non-specific endonuclease [Mucilaginibacter sp. 14171R-50]QHS56538.1 hypothetical protein GWR56_13675 [Mucilaginibacter sp. 14171R-50]
MTDYYRIFSAIPGPDYEQSVVYLRKELAYHLTEEYESKFEDAEVRYFNDNVNRNYTLYFDCTEDPSPDIFSRTARVIFILARSAANTSVRKNYRMKQFLGPFKDTPAFEGYDKGHFIAHCNDGQLDQNIYPQLRELNRGLSLQGKLFRAMERYCQNNLGVFYFVRPIYSDLTWIPEKIDFGVYTTEGGILMNRFNNRANNTMETKLQTNNG